MAEAPLPPLTLSPVGVVRSPFRDRLAAPRQPAAALGVEGRIELFPATGIEHALEDLSSFRYIWVLFWFHRNQGFRPKVLPPRSQRRRGVFATRSPYRPNPIGLSAVELVTVEGLVLTVRNVDMLDGTPVLDIKPYVPYTDAIASAQSGWLDTAERPADPLSQYEVHFTELARAQLRFLEEHHRITLEAPVVEVLKLGPTPHAYRRIKRTDQGWVLAYKEWRLCFGVEGRSVHVSRIRSGYRPSELYRSKNQQLLAHREFIERFGA